MGAGVVSVCWVCVMGKIRGDGLSQGMLGAYSVLS